MKTKKPLGVVAKFAASLSAIALLASCGGGEAYEGYWEGEMSPQRQVAGLVLESGEYYMLYTQPASRTVLAGFVRGNAQFEAAKVTSTGTVDYNWERPFTPPSATTLSARIGQGGTLSGTTGGRSFSVKPVPDAQLEARLADVAGAHVGKVVFTLGPRDAVFTVDAQGNVSTTVNDCDVKGKVVPRLDVNAYDLTMDFSGVICAFPGTRFTGVAFFDPDRRNLYAAVSGLTRGFGPQGIGFISPKR